MNAVALIRVVLLVIAGSLRDRVAVGILLVPEASLPCTVGMVAKLYSGGGEGIDHSSVLPSQGSFPAGSPLRTLQKKLCRNISTERTIMRDPSRGYKVPQVPSHAGLIGGLPPRHPVHAQEVHREEGDVEACEHNPEAELA